MTGRRPAAALALRAGSPADAAAIARVMRAAVRAAPGPYGARARAAWGGLPALYHRWAMTAGGEAYVVAERGGRVVGYGARRGGELTALFVLPSAGGRGVGAALVARPVAAARRAGARRVRVDAALGAAPFYARLGFAGRRRLRVPLPGGASLPALRMTRALAPPRPRPAGARPRAAPVAAR